MVWLNRCMKAMILAVSSGTSLYGEPAMADKIPNRVAVFSFLDKVTARISSKAIPLNTIRSIRFAQGYTARMLYAAADRGAQDNDVRRSRRSEARWNDAAHLLRLDARPKSRPQCRRASGLRCLADRLPKAGGRRGTGCRGHARRWHRAGGRRRRARRQAPGQAPIARPSIRRSLVRGLTLLGLTPYIRQPYTAGRSSSVG